MLNSPAEAASWFAVLWRFGGRHGPVKHARQRLCRASPYPEPKSFPELCEEPSRMGPESLAAQGAPLPATTGVRWED